MEGLLLDNPWIPLLLCVAVMTADYVLDVYELRAYHAYVKRTIVFERIYQLPEPVSREASTRWLVVKLGAILLLLVIAVPVLWDALVLQTPHRDAFAFLLGGFLLAAAASLIRHGRTWTLFRHVRSGDSITGHITYGLRFILAEHWAELLGFAVLFALIFIMTGSWFFLGGAFTCFISGRRVRDRAMIAFKETQRT